MDKKQQRVWIKPVCLVVLSLLTYVWFTQIDRYRAAGPNLIQNGRFAPGLAHWTVAGEGTATVDGNGVVELSTIGDQSVELSQSFTRLHGESIWRFSAEVRTENLMAGPKANQQGGMRVAAFDGNEKTINPVWAKPASFEGTLGWRAQQALIGVSEDTAGARLAVGISKTSGKMWIRQVGFRKVAVASWFNWGHGVFVLVWIVFCVWWAFPAVKYFELKPRWAAFGVLLILIFFAILAPQSTISEVKVTVTRTVNTAIDWGTTADRLSPEQVAAGRIENRSLNHIENWGVFKKIDGGLAVHAFLFFLFALTASMSFSGFSSLRVLSHLVTFAGVSEVLQLMTLYRAAQVSDFGLNCVGVVVGFAFYRLMRFLKTKISARSSM